MSINIQQRGSISMITNPKDLSKPWVNFDWNSCIQSRLYEDWGKYFGPRLLPQKALKSYNKSLTVCKENDTLDAISCSVTTRVCRKQYLVDCKRHYKTLLLRSKCKASMGNIKGSLDDAYFAEKLAQKARTPEIDKIERNVCDGLLGANQFENYAIKLHSFNKKHYGNSTKNFIKRGFDVIGKTFDDTLGETLGHFMIDNEETIKSVHKQHKLHSTVDNRLLWRKLKEQNQCDVESVIAQQEPFVSPLERARRQACKDIINNLYFHKSARDVAFLKQLSTSSNMASPIFGFATANLKNFLNQQNDSIHTFLKTLHARNPLYNANYEKCQGMNMCEKNRENYLYHVQYQTRRDCHRILRTIRMLRKENNIQRLTNYIEDAMGNYIVLKTHRTLPWKFEFMNDVYNTLGSALIDACKAPKNIQLLDRDNKALLYRIPIDDKVSMDKKDFGYNIYKELIKNEAQHNSILNRIDRLEKRLLNSQYHIERSYLFYEIARNHFLGNRFDECIDMANKAINEATAAHSLVWCFNSEFLICKVHVSLSRYERLKENLSKVYVIAKRLKNRKLVTYVHICRTVNDHELLMQKLQMSDRGIRKRRGKASNSLIMISK